MDYQKFPTDRKYTLSEDAAAKVAKPAKVLPFPIKTLATLAGLAGALLEKPESSIDAPTGSNVIMFNAAERRSHDK